MLLRHFLKINVITSLRVLFGCGIMTSCVAWVGKMRGTLAEDQIHAASTRRAKSTRLAWELSVNCRYSTTYQKLFSR